MELSYISDAVLVTEIVDLYVSRFYFGDSLGAELPAFSTPGVVTVNRQGAASFSIDSLLFEPDCVVEGDTGEVEVFLDNEYEAGGFQMNLTFDTEILDYIQINPKPRTEGFQYQQHLTETH